MYHIKVQLSIFLLGLFTLSCVAPKPVIRVTSKETKTTWENGKEFTSYFKDGFICHAAYHGITGPYLVFDVELANTTDDDFLICPEKMAIYTDNGTWDQTSNQIIYSNFPIYGTDPELEILKNELAQSQLEANQKNDTAVAVTVGALAVPLIIAAASADVNDNSQHAISRTELAATSTTAALNVMDISQDLNQIKNEMLYMNSNIWINNALRKTTLSKNESVRGLVYFKTPNLKKFPEIQLDVPIGNNNFISFTYLVKLYYPQQQDVQAAFK